MNTRVRPLRWVFFLALALVWSVALRAPQLRAQTYLQSAGAPTFTTLLPVENGWADVSNGRLHLGVPLASYPQRDGNSLSIALVYDSNIWMHTTSGWSPTNISTSDGSTNSWGGWRLVTTGDSGSVTYRTRYSGWCQQGAFPRTTYYDTFVWTAPDGTTHSFPIQTFVTVDCTSGMPISYTDSGTAYATDATAYYMSVTSYNTAVVYANDGTIVSGPVIDTNGNYFSATSDTLGRTPLSTTTSGNTITYTVLTPQGSGAGTYTVTTQTVNVQSNFGQSGLTECTTSCTITVVQSIQFPDQSSYSFKYDCDSTLNAACSSPAGQSAYYGLLTSMTLSTGATINYTWQVIGDAQGNRYTWMQQRTTPDGPWGYAQTVATACGSGQVDCQQTNKITKPNGDTILYTFTLNGGAWQSTTQYYTGSSSLLSTVNQCWNFVSINSNGQCTYSVTTASPATNVLKAAISTTMQMPSGTLTKTTEYTYDTYGNTTQIQEWNYYPGNLPTTAGRTTTIAYQQASNYVNAHILNRPVSVTVTNSGGGTVAQALYTYDGGTLTAAPAGLPGHDDYNYGTGKTTRGNVTLVQKLVSGSTYLNSSASYDSAGSLQTQTDFNSNATNYTYSSTYFDAYPNTISKPAGLSTTIAYDLNTGLVASVTDANNQTTGFTYDRMFRPLIRNYPNGGQDSFSYTDVNPFSVQLTTKITSALNAIGTTTLDTLGRRSTVTLNSDPDGATSVNTTYDANGRVYTVSNPHRSTSSPTDGVEAFGYDGLDRQLTDTHADNTVAHTYYGPSVTSAGGLASQQGSPSSYGYGYPVLTIDEAGNQRQVWIDGFGRTIETDEPVPVTAPTSATGSATINGSEQSHTTYGTSSAGPNGAGSGSDAGGGSVAWSNPNSITAGGPASASISYTSGDIGTNSLHATNFGFNLPSNTNSIIGIQVQVSRGGSSYSDDFGNTNLTTDNGILLINGAGNTVGNDHSDYNDGWDTLTNISYGGSTDNWGAGLTYTDINSPNFGVAIAGQFCCGVLNLNGRPRTVTMTAQVYSVTITVWYSTPTSTTYDTGTVWINVNGFQVSTSYGQSSAGNSIASALATALNAGGSPVTASASGTVISLTSKATGSISNYPQSAGSSTNNPGGFFSSPSFTVSLSGNTLTGGNDPGGGSLSSPAVTLYTYDLNNNLTGVVSAGGQQNICNSIFSRCFSYDMLSRVTASTTPETGTTNFYYTTAGGSLCTGDPSEICRRTDARSITTTYSYDVLNRLTSKSYSDGTATANYYYEQTSYNGLGISNGKGRRTGMSDGSGQTAWSYDSNGNVLTERRTIGSVAQTISYTYNLDNSVATVTYPSNRVVTYTPGGAQRPTAAKNTSNNINYAEPSSLAMYAPTGAPLNIVYGYVSGVFNGITETRAYNKRLGITSILANSSTATALNLTFSYPTANNGNISTQTNNVDTGRTQAYKMDVLNRLMSVETNANSGVDCWGQSFTYDALANFGSGNSVKCSNPAAQYGVDVHNHINSPTGYSYDLAGNSTADAQYSYTYDAENRIKSASGMPGGPYCYTYDGTGLRVAKSNGASCTSATVDVMYWRNLGGQTIAETDSSGSTTDANYHEYVFFAGRRVARSDPSSGIQYYYFVDQIGSTRSVAEVTPSNSPTDGTVCFSEDYYPYGQEINYGVTCPQNYKFTGYERDAETGLDYALVRYYNDRLARFMSPDPLGGDVTNPQTLNGYSYVINSPCSLSDPWGLSPCTYKIRLTPGRKSPLSDPKFAAALKGEISRIFDLADLGVAFVDTENDYTLVVGNVPSGVNLEAGAGGFTLHDRLTGSILPRGFIYQSRFEQFDPATAQSSYYLGIAMGRAGAHEIGHFLLQIGKDHPASGLMAAAPAGPGGSIWHLPDSTGRFAFTGDQVLTLQSDCQTRHPFSGAVGGIGPGQYTIYFPVSFSPGSAGDAASFSFGLPVIIGAPMGWQLTRPNPN
jgi:RHS repeat-associated protein